MYYVSRLNASSLRGTQELHVYLDSFRRGGIKHPLNYYRNRRVCYDEEIGSFVTLQSWQAVVLIFASTDRRRPVAAIPCLNSGALCYWNE